MNDLTGRRVAIANRGEIAVRIAATCRRLGAVPILLLGEPDWDGYAARQVGRVEHVGPAGSELDVELVVAAAKRAKAEFLHPGYGFLSERAALADACEREKIRFVGPSPATLLLCGDKLATRNAAVRAGVPVLPASSPLEPEPSSWLAVARTVGYPLLVKPAEAGGGRGLRLVADENGLVDAVAASRRESASSGAGETIYLERALIDPRHIEVQVIADGQQVLALGDRDCSLQRRHQKVIEEAPAPNVDGQVRRALHDHARRIAGAVELRGIATCEFLLGGDGTIAFLEVNPRIQVEHPVTEMVTGVDLVEWQLLIAAGGSIPIHEAPAPRGHSIEARVYAEDPARGFFPASGLLWAVDWPVRPGVRVDAGYATGDTVPSTYDAMLAKVVAHASDRQTAIAVLRHALHDSIVAGVPSNISWLLALLDDGAVEAGRATTRTAGEIAATVTDRRMAILAATARALDTSRAGGTDPWSAIGAFRLSGVSTLRFHGDDWEDQIAVSRSGQAWEVSIGGETVTLRWWRDTTGIWTISTGDRVARLAVVERNDALEVSGDGGRWTVSPGPLPTSGAVKRRRASDGKVKAPLPGKVLRISVKPGDRVVAGQAVVALSAMKMELVCEAPAAGVVDAISCTIDQIVAADDVLATIRIDEAAESSS